MPAPTIATSTVTGLSSREYRETEAESSQYDCVSSSAAFAIHRPPVTRIRASLRPLSRPPPDARHTAGRRDRHPAAYREKLLARRIRTAVPAGTDLRGPPPGRHRDRGRRID